MNEEIKWPKITKDTPLPELKRIHQTIWDYAIEHGEKPETPYVHDCVACEYDECGRGECYDCPIKWPKNDDEVDVCVGWGGLYYRWQRAKGKKKTALAKQISDLPWKFELGE